MAVPRKTMEKDLKAEEKGKSRGLDGLNKKARLFFVKPPYQAHDSSEVQVPRKTIQ